MATERTRDRLVGRLLAAWQLFQERNRVVSKSYSSPVSLLELNVLIEASIGDVPSGSELARRFNVGPLAVSRALANLERGALITRVRGEEDARSKTLRLTSAGTRALAAIDDEANQVLDDMNPELSRRELGELVLLLNAVAEGFPLEFATGRPVDHPLRPAVRTLTRGLGLLEGSVFGLGELAMFEWHVLAAVARGGGRVRALDLCKRFDASRSSVSVLLKRLEETGLVRRESGQGREKPVSLLPRGRSVLDRHSKSGCALFHAAARALNDGKLERLCILMERLVDRQPVLGEVRVTFDFRPLTRKDSSPEQVGLYLGSVLVSTFDASEMAEITEEDVARVIENKLAE